MEPSIGGLHHITAISGDAQGNVDFYAGLLGLRLVKLTVNFDDPGSYHLYYGDGDGRPGSLITFFAWNDAPRGRIGTGQVTATAFSIPATALGFWTNRLRGHGVAVEGPSERLGEPVLAFADPDGLPLELIAPLAGDARPAWEAGPLPAAEAIRGLHSVTLSEEGYERTAGLLTQTLGCRRVAEVDGRFRYAVAAGGPGELVDVVCRPDARPGEVAVGTVHHMAWRTPDDAQQAAWRRALAALGYNVSPVMDRQYFHSIYFREPGGVLFEIATDPPGFATDEPAEHLGERLRLPPSLEPHRERIEAWLPPLRLPDPRREAAT
jgi:glyoxalase family protein